MRRALGFCFFLLGCSLDENGLGPFDAGLADAASSVDAPGEAAQADAAQDVAPDAPAEAADNCSPDSCQGERCTAGACDYYPGCAAMHTADPTRTTGMHHFKGGNGPFDAWCDMDTDSGGWTLVARSVTLGSSSSFGWFSASSSDPTNRTTPYSLDAPAMGITFTQALVGQVDELASGPNVWGGNVNRLDLPGGFPGNFKGSAAGAVVTVLTTTGGCQSSDVTMLTNVGYTGKSSQFFFRDNTADGSYGLSPDAFHLNFFLSCKAAEMDSSAGMIMVR